MNKKIQFKILNILKENGGQISVGYLGVLLKSKVLEKTKTGVDLGSHNLNLLIDQKKIEYANPEKVSVRLTNVGWQEFDNKLIKFWRFFTNDMAKILSIISLIISSLVGLNQLGFI